jgi:hypothetical protein
MLQDKGWLCRQARRRFNLLDIEVNYCIINEYFWKKQLTISAAYGNSLTISFRIDNIFKVINAETMKPNKNN